MVDIDLQYQQGTWFFTEYFGTDSINIYPVKTIILWTFFMYYGRDIW